MSELDDKLKKKLKEVYDELAANQEPLGPEFQKVIDDNFWDLLVKEPEKDDKVGVEGEKR